MKQSAKAIALKIKTIAAITTILVSVTQLKDITYHTPKEKKATAITKRAITISFSFFSFIYSTPLINETKLKSSKALQS